MTINTYIKNRRLSLAGIEILNTNEKIIDIALKYGYATPESFTKAFTRFHKIAPKYARDNGAKLTLFNPINIKITIEGGDGMDYRIVQKKTQKFLAIVRSFKNEIINDENNHEIPDFWKECQDNKLIDMIFNLRKNGKRDLYGLCSPSKEGEVTFDYGIGILIDEDTMFFNLNEMEKLGFKTWDVKESYYAVFECVGEDADCISDTWAKFFKEFLPQTGYHASEATDLEIYYENSKDGLFCELWIPINK